MAASRVRTVATIRGYPRVEVAALVDDPRALARTELDEDWTGAGAPEALERWR